MSNEQRIRFVIEQALRAEDELADRLEHVAREAVVHECVREMVAATAKELKRTVRKCARVATGSDAGAVQVQLKQVVYAVLNRIADNFGRD